MRNAHSLVSEGLIVSMLLAPNLSSFNKPHELFPLFLCAFLHIFPLCVLFGIELAKRHFLACAVDTILNIPSYLLFQFSK